MASSPSPSPSPSPSKEPDLPPSPSAEVPSSPSSALGPEPAPVANISYPDPSTFSRLVRWHVSFENHNIPHAQHILLVPVEYGVYYTLIYLWNELGLSRSYGGKTSPFQDGETNNNDEQNSTPKNDKNIVWWVHYTQMDNSTKKETGSGEFHSPNQTKATKDGKSKVLNADKDDNNNQLNIGHFDQAFQDPLRKEFTSWTRLTTTFTLYTTSKLPARGGGKLYGKAAVLQLKETTIRCTCYDRHKSSVPNTIDCAYISSDHPQEAPFATMEERQGYPKLSNDPHHLAGGGCACAIM